MQGLVGGRGGGGAAKTEKSPSEKKKRTLAGGDRQRKAEKRWRGEQHVHTDTTARFPPIYFVLLFFFSRQGWVLTTFSHNVPNNEPVARIIRNPTKTYHAILETIENRPPEHKTPSFCPWFFFTNVSLCDQGKEKKTFLDLLGSLDDEGSRSIPSSGGGINRENNRCS